MNHPFVIFGISLSLLWFSTRAGIFLRMKRRHIPEEGRDDLVMVMSAALTLLGLLIGFSFSMAISRYDLRKSYEEAEANAIGTEYVRADLLPAASASKLRPLLRKYLDQRILFYTTGQRAQRSSLNADTARIQSELWSTVSAAAAVQVTPMVALAVAGMNDVLNSQGYTQAAWWNRIPVAAWVLMFAIAICCSLLVG